MGSLDRIDVSWFVEQVALRLAQPGALPLKSEQSAAFIAGFLDGLRDWGTENGKGQS